MKVLPLALLAVLQAPNLLASGYEFEGVGARQIARGGAAVADSDDWTAVYWNPANIVRGVQGKKVELGGEVFGGRMYAKDSDSLSSLPGVGPIFSDQTMSAPFILGAMGVLVPLGSRVGVGFGFYTPLLQGSKFQDRSPQTGTVIDYRAYAAILTYNASASFRLTEDLSAGAGLNVLQGRMKSDMTLSNTAGLAFPLPLFGDPLHSQIDAGGYGLEGIFGLRYNPHPMLSLGTTYRTGSDILLKGDASASASNLPSESSGFRFTLRHPPTLDAGLALRPSKRCTFSFDVHETFWNRFTNERRYDSPGILLANSGNTFNWRDTYKLRFGLRQRLGESDELLAGFTFDRHAVDSDSIDLANTVEVSMNRFSGGFAHRWNRVVETILGATGGTGTRTVGPVDYRMSGVQLMLETRYFL
jgi:long-chain fatty acid transport protein